LAGIAKVSAGIAKVSAEIAKVSAATATELQIPTGTPVHL